jgi:hypothetical protein
MMEKSKDQLIAQLKKEGFSFNEFSLEHEGNYSVEDADWNYKDIPHLHHVHALVEAVPCHVSDHSISNIFVQRVLGFKIPLTVYIYENTPTSQLYYTTCLFYVMIIESVYHAISANRTRVITTYAIGCSKWLAWTFPIMRWLIKRNYQDLMSADIPMRERRGQLRSMGYDFHKNGKTYSYLKSLNTIESNVLAPLLTENTIDIELNISEILPLDGEYFLGNDDAWGLRILRKEDKLLIFQRMCPHEGASLDKQKCEFGKIKCPWHGRMHSPLAIFSLNSENSQSLSSKFHHFILAENVLTVIKQNPATEIDNIQGSVYACN